MLCVLCVFVCLLGYFFKTIFFMLFYVFSCCLVQLSLFILKFVFQHLFLVSIPWVFKIVLVMCAVCFVLSDIF